MLSCTIQSGRSVSTRARIPKSEAFAGQGDVTLLPGPSGKVRGHDHDASRPACGQGPKLISRPSLLVIPSREQFNRRSRGGGKSGNHAALAGFPSEVGKSCLWTFPRSGFFHGPLPTNTAIEPELRGSPIRRQIRCGHPAAQRFFYPGPDFSFPARDFIIILLPRTPFGFLGTPFQAVHQPTDMGAVIADSELPPDYLSNADRGPEIRPVAMRDRSLQE